MQKYGAIVIFTKFPDFSRISWTMHVNNHFGKSSMIVIVVLCKTGQMELAKQKVDK